MYIQRQDIYGKPIPEALGFIKVVNVPLDSILTNVAVTVPEGAYGVAVNDTPDAFKFKMKINEFDAVTCREGAQFSPVAAGISSVVITTTSAVAGGVIELLFIS